MEPYIESKFFASREENMILMGDSGSITESAIWLLSRMLGKNYGLKHYVVDFAIFGINPKFDVLVARYLYEKYGFSSCIVYDAECYTPLNMVVSDFFNARNIIRLSQMVFGKWEQDARIGYSNEMSFVRNTEHVSCIHTHVSRDKEERQVVIVAQQWVDNSILSLIHI